MIRVARPLPALLLLLIAACSPVDRWSVLERDLQNKINTQVGQPIELPDSAMPAMATQPGVVEIPTDGSPLALSVEQAVFLAMQNNRDLRIRQLNPVIAGTFEQIERGRFDPEVFAGYEYNREIASETARSTGAQFSSQTEDTTGEVGIRQTLPTGTTVEASTSLERNQSNRAPEQQQARVGLTMTQALLRGFGPAVNLASVRQAELETLRSQYELRGFAEALLADVETTYWQYVLAAREIAIFERSLEVSKQQLDEIEQQVEVGVLADSVAAPARAEVARREQALIDARAALEARRLRLARLISAGPTGDLALPMNPTSDPTLEAEPLDDVPERLQLADRMRPELNEAQLQLDQRRLELIVTRNGLLPRLDLFATIGKSGYDDEFAQSYKDLEEDAYDFTAGISYNQYLGNRAAEGRNRAALANRQQAAKAIANLRQLVRLEVMLAVNELERARQQIHASKTTREFEQQTVQAEIERFNVGTGTAILVAQAQRDLLAAEINEVRAVIGYRIALVNLYLAEGSLLERRGVSIGPATAMRGR